MFAASKLTTLRKRHYGLGTLPASICVQSADRQASSVKPIEKATLDDVAFAIVRAEQTFNIAADRLSSLRRLHDLARKAGGIGSGRAVEAAAKARSEY